MSPGDVLPEIPRPPINFASIVIRALFLKETLIATRVTAMRKMLPSLSISTSVVDAVSELIRAGCYLIMRTSGIYDKHTRFP